MSANDLLLWMSARGQGSWSQFRAAVEELHIAEENVSSATKDGPVERDSLPLYQSLRLNLERFGHAEFFNGVPDNDWRITPPSLSLVRTNDRTMAVVAGARSDRLLQRLLSASQQHCEIETLPIEGGPDQIRLFSDEIESFDYISNQTGMLLQREAPTALLMSLPAVDHPAVRTRDDLPFGASWKVEQFSTTTLGWKLATHEHAQGTALGLFRFSLPPYRFHTMLCLRGEAYRLPAQVGKYILLRHRRRQILSYDASSERLSLPASCRPPSLIERALVLCSGLLPSYEARSSSAGLLHYSDIPENVARVAASLLRQSIQ